METQKIINLLNVSDNKNSTCATYKKCYNGRANSKIGYTTDWLYSFRDRQKAKFCML